MRRITSVKALVLSALLLGTVAQAKVKNASSGNLIISKVFYAGTTQLGNNKNYTGGEEYIELYNNSGDTLNIAGIYIGLVESESGSGAWTPAALTEASGVSNAVGLKQLYRVPADYAKELLPYTSVLIAGSAIDHRTLGENGPDLSGADFEFANPVTDNDQVPNLELVFTYMSSVTAFNLTNGGDAGVLLFPSNFEGKFDPAKAVYAQGKTSGSQYLPVNAYNSIDAVEILKAKKDADGNYVADAARKRIPTTYDANYVVTPTDASMLRDGNVVYRKTGLASYDRIYLYDRSDSQTDFAVSSTIAPRAYNQTEDGTTDTTVVIPASGYLPFNASSYFFTGKELGVAYVNVSAGVVSFRSFPGDSLIASNSVYLLVGAPGEHVVKYTKANRMIATSGANSWIAEGDDRYADGVYTETRNNRFPLKFVNEAGNVRFVRDAVDGNPKTMKIDVETEGRFYITLTTSDTDVLAWGGITPEEVVAVGIGDVRSLTIDQPVYTLQGMRVRDERLPRGLYIRGGKKFLVK